MVFLVGVVLLRSVTPTRCVQRLRSAVACAARSAMADLNRGRMALPPLRVEGAPSTQGEAHPPQLFTLCAERNASTKAREAAAIADNE